MSHSQNQQTPSPINTDLDLTIQEQNQNQNSPEQTSKQPSSFPIGTFGVIGFLLLTISTLWLLIMGVLQGRA